MSRIDKERLFQHANTLQEHADSLDETLEHMIKRLGSSQHTKLQNAAIGLDQVIKLIADAARETAS